MARRERPFKGRQFTAEVILWAVCTATNSLDTGEGLRGSWSGLWACDLKEECHRARPGQAQAAVAGACGPA